MMQLEDLEHTSMHYILMFLGGFWAWRLDWHLVYWAIGSSPVDWVSYFGFGLLFCIVLIPVGLACFGMGLLIWEVYEGENPHVGKGLVFSLILITIINPLSPNRFLYPILGWIGLGQLADPAMQHRFFASLVAIGGCLVAGHMMQFACGALQHARNHRRHTNPVKKADGMTVDLDKPHSIGLFSPDRLAVTVCGVSLGAVLANQISSTWFWYVLMAFWSIGCFRLGPRIADYFGTPKQAVLVASGIGLGAWLIDVFFLPGPSRFAGLGFILWSAVAVQYFRLPLTREEVRDLLWTKFTGMSPTRRGFRAYSQEQKEQLGEYRKPFEELLAACSRLLGAVENFPEANMSVEKTQDAVNGLTENLFLQANNILRMLQHEGISNETVRKLTEEISKLTGETNSARDEPTRLALQNTVKQLRQRLDNIEIIQLHKKRFEVNMGRIIAQLDAIKSTVVRVAREGADRGEAKEIETLLSELSHSVKVGETVTHDLQLIRNQEAPNQRRRAAKAP